MGEQQRVDHLVEEDVAGVALAEETLQAPCVGLRIEQRRVQRDPSVAARVAELGAMRR